MHNEENSMEINSLCTVGRTTLPAANTHGEGVSGREHGKREIWRGGNVSPAKTNYSINDGGVWYYAEVDNRTSEPPESR